MLRDFLRKIINPLSSGPGGPPGLAVKPAGKEGNPPHTDPPAVEVNDPDGVSMRGEAAQILQAIYDASPDMLFVHGPDGRIIDVNDRVLQTYGYSREEMCKLSPEILSGPHYSTAQALEYIQQALNGELPEFDWEARTQDGVLIPIEVRLRRFQLGEAYGVIAVVRDISERKAYERRFNETLEQLRALYEASPDMLFVHDSSGRIVDVNDRTLETYGYTKQEIRQLSVQELSAPGYDNARAFTFIQQAMEGGTPDFDWQAMDSHGRVFPVEVRLRRVELASGTGIVAAVRDLSERREAEEHLKILSMAVEQGPSMVMITDPEGIIEYVNACFTEVSGYRPEELSSGTPRQLQSGNTPRDVYRNLWRAISKGGQWRGTLCDRSKGGEPFWVSQVISPIFDSEGKIIHFVSVMEDITAKRHMEEELLRLEVQWNRAMDFFNDPLYLVDLDDRLVRGNKAFYRMLGMNPEQVVGQDISQIIHPGGEAVPCPVCQARHERRDLQMVMEAEHPDNPASVPLEIMLRVIRNDDDEPLGILMGLRDLTPQRNIERELRQNHEQLEELVQKRTAELEASNRELESFSYSVSHDLRAPLRGIDGFSLALLEDYGDRLDEVGRDYLQRVRSGAQRMGSLIDDLLQLSRMSRRSIHKERIDLSQIAHDVVEELWQLDPNRVVDVDIMEGMQAEADPGLVKLILENLIGNAWKYTGKTPHAAIRIAQLKDEQAAVFMVEDNGAGFDMAFADKLFGAFQRLHKMEEYPGSGIGLATVQRLIHRHGGRVWAEGEPGRGARFYFSLGAVKAFD